MAFYDDMAATALRLLAQFGRDIALERVSEAYDPQTGDTVSSIENGTVKGAVLPVTKDNDNGLFEGLERHRVRFVVCEAVNAPFEPKQGDLMTFDGYKWTVKGATPINPAGTPVAYRVGVSR